MTKGHCVVCGIEGSGTKSFICEHCGGHDKIVHFCSGCRARTLLDIAALDVIQKYTTRPIPRRMGVTVKATCCSKCVPEGTEVNLTIFALRL